ncbi:hypothetical protein LSAT2_007761 [Lamellibrachia satsuma]|nr:hypothetical protein LSAT2_007761 [Lamellibrachia satsuma]
MATLRLMGVPEAKVRMVEGTYEETKEDDVALLHSRMTSATRDVQTRKPPWSCLNAFTVDDVIVEDDDDTDDDDMYPGRCMRMNFDGHHGNSNTGSGSPQGRRYRKNSRHDSQRSRYHYQRYYRRQPHQTQTRGTIPTPSGAPQDATQSAFNVPHACVSPPVNETELPSGGAAVNSKSKSAVVSSGQCGHLSRQTNSFWPASLKGRFSSQFLDGSILRDLAFVGRWMAGLCPTSITGTPASSQVACASKDHSSRLCLVNGNTSVVDVTNDVSDFTDDIPNVTGLSTLGHVSLVIDTTGKAVFHSGTGHTAGNMDDNIVCDCGIDRTLDETDLRRHDDVLRHHFGGRVGQRLHTASLKFSMTVTL